MRPFLEKIVPGLLVHQELLLFLMLITFLIFNKHLEKQILKVTIYVLISTFILLFQSRTTIVIITFILMNYIYEKNFSIKER